MGANGRGVMSRMTGLMLMGALLSTVPARAQMSDSYNFLKAVKDRDANKATDLVKRPGTTPINTRDAATGETALHIAVKRRDAAWVAFALVYGADMTLRDNQGDTALTAAAKIGFTDGANLLIGQGANVNAMTSRGETPLILAVQRRDTEMVRTLIGAGADPRLTDHVTGQSALDYAKVDPRGGPILALLQQAKPAAPKRMIGPQP